MTSCIYRAGPSVLPAHHHRGGRPAVATTAGDGGRRESLLPRQPMIGSRDSLTLRHRRCSVRASP
jgi:hypothetical protein